jgi:tetratricopeptide (TPR) repeat protein
MKEAFPVSDSAYLSGPPVILRSAQETLRESQGDRYKADQTYLGNGMGDLLLLGPIPSWVGSDEFRADIPRTNIIKEALFSELRSRGIPLVYQAETRADQFMMLPEDRLGISMRLRELTVDTQLDFFVPTIFLNAFTFHDRVAHAVLDCQLWQPGQTAPLWEGTGEGRHSTKDEKHQTGNVVGDAVFAAVDQCVTKSGLVETRVRLSGQRYAKLMMEGRKDEEAANATKALDLYIQAYITAITPEQGVNAAQAMARVISKAKPILSEEARRLKVQAEGAVRDKKFKDAAEFYGELLRIAPWWPEGYFNRAVIFGELKKFPMAIQEMKRYLLLAPNAPNARTVQDNIYEWERKAR